MSSSHYIRTIHTSFTAAHPNPWAARSAAGPLLSPSSSPMHSQPLYSSSSSSPNQYHHHQATPTPSKPLTPGHHAPPASGAGGRRRAYAFRVPSTATNGGYGAGGQKPKFDPFADEPTSPVPSIAHLASLSTPPTPRLAAASLPPVHRASQGYQGSQGGGGRRQHQQGYGNQGFYGGYYGQQQQQQPRRSGFPGQRSRSPAPSFVLDSSPSASVYSAHGPTEVYRSARAQAWDPQFGSEFEFDNHGMGGRGGGNGGLVEYTERPAQGRVSGSTPRRSPSPPQPPIARRSPSPPTSSYAQPPSRQLTPSSPPQPIHTQPPQKTPAQLQADKDAKARLVAGILLNRIHVPKTGRARRVPSPVGEKRVYRPSGLRECVAVA